MMMMDTTSGEQAGPLDSPRAGDVPAIAATFTVVKIDEAQTEAMDAESNNNHIEVHEYKEHRKSKKKKRDKRDKERRSEKHHRRERDGERHHHRRHRDRERDDAEHHHHNNHHHQHAHLNHSTSASSSPSSSASSFLSATISNEYIAVSPAASSPCCSVVSAVSSSASVVTATTATALSYPHNLKIRFLLSGVIIKYTYICINMYAYVNIVIYSERCMLLGYAVPIYIVTYAPTCCIPYMFIYIHM